VFTSYARPLVVLIVLCTLILRHNLPESSIAPYLTQLQTRVGTEGMDMYVQESKNGLQVNDGATIASHLG